ncbi:hypothetical protein Fmac_007744 [Flemingia macrophylla]|uniref:WAT1-related protein n=1 Tax=Flemingia macrophylla TaxID=520843 RepID=A0ABD1MVI7_9FABA
MPSTSPPLLSRRLPSIPNRNIHDALLAAKSSAFFTSVIRADIKPFNRNPLLQLVRGNRPKLVAVGLQFGFAGAYIFSVACLNHGMNRYVFVVYRNAIAALALAPFAFIFERPVIDQGFTFLGMQYTSASFASAIMNAVPSVTFVLAVILRIERVNVKEVRSLAKVIGTLVTFSGALSMTLYKGTLFLLLGCVAWSSFFILQSITLKRYPAELSLSSLVCLSGALQASVVALVATRHSGLGAWALGWNFSLYGPLYTGWYCKAEARTASPRQYHWSNHYRTGPILCGVGHRERLFRPHSNVTYNNHKANADTTVANYLISCLTQISKGISE